jgi:hypothetical protein
MGISQAGPAPRRQPPPAREEEEAKPTRFARSGLAPKKSVSDPQGDAGLVRKPARRYGKWSTAFQQRRIAAM